MNFYADYAQKPDLYGPLWILSTLVVFLFVSGNIQRYALTPADKEFTYHFKVIPIATTIVFVIGFGLPLLMKFLLNYYGSGNKSDQTPVVQAVGIFGYSFTSFLLPVMICAAPISWL